MFVSVRRHGDWARYNVRRAEIPFRRHLCEAVGWAVVAVVDIFTNAALIKALRILIHAQRADDALLERVQVGSFGWYMGLMNRQFPRSDGRQRDTKSRCCGFQCQRNISPRLRVREFGCRRFAIEARTSPVDCVMEALYMT